MFRSNGVETQGLLSNDCKILFLLVMYVRIKAVNKFYNPLVMYGEGGKMEDGILQDGEAQLMMGRMVPVLQVLYQHNESINTHCTHNIGPGQFCWKNI